MKKYVVLPLALFIAGCFASCVIQNGPTSPPAPETASATPETAAPASAGATAPAEETDKASGYIERMEDGDLYTRGMTRVGIEAVRLTRDKLAVIELYTSAQRDDRGEMMWDDGQEWALVARDGNFIYPLFEKKYVQIGEVSFESAWDEGTGVETVTVHVRQHELTDSYKCVYEAEGDRFARVDLPQETDTE